MKTVLDCLESGSRYLQERGVSDARRNMQLLVAKELGCSRLDLYLEFDRPLEEAELEPLRAALKRRGAGEPLQHLLGTVEFHGREYRCDRRALIPRPETEELVEAILKLDLPTPARILDLGTGSGVLGIAVALDLAGCCGALTLADRSPEALELARENATLQDCGAETIETDLFERIEGTFELITANLPYVPEGASDELAPELRHDPPAALFSGPDGLDLIRRIIPAALAHLAPGGWLAMEIGHQQGDTVIALLEKAGYAGSRCARDLSGHPRHVFAQAPPAS